MTPRVVSRTPLLYADGADPTLDRPGHVRAGSALVIWREQLAVIQDDASFIALIDRKSGRVRDVPFPGTNVRQFDDARGNKKSKLDLEAAFVFEGRLVAIGSGSSPLRERFVIVDDAVTLREMHAFYKGLRAVFAGELNLEGAVVDGADLLLFQRGNGVGAKNQTARVGASGLLHGPAETVPDVRDVTTWALPDALTFTDATRRGDGSIWFLACAEDSPDATRDGPVSAVSLGRMTEGAAETWPILDEHGAPLLEKTEGLAFDPDDASRLFVVTDRDDATLPSHLLVVSVS
ncbi:MAG: hypothetical protein U0270_45905 [Labilithrix sp.]